MSQGCYDIIVPDTAAQSLKLTANQSSPKLPIELDGPLAIRPVLTYQFHATNPQNLTYSVDIVDGNGATYHVSTHSLNSDVQRVYQDVVPQNALMGPSPQLKIKVESGTGELTVSNIVLWYRT